MAELSVTRAELDELGEKLEAADLTDKERQVLLALFAVADEALSGQEVSGFSFSFGAPPVPGVVSPPSLGGGLSLAFNNSFLSGPRFGQGDDGEHIQVGTVK